MRAKGIPRIANVPNVPPKVGRTVDVKESKVLWFAPIDEVVLSPRKLCLPSIAIRYDKELSAFPDDSNLDSSFMPIYVNVPCHDELVNIGYWIGARTANAHCRKKRQQYKRATKTMGAKRTHTGPRCRGTRRVKGHYSSHPRTITPLVFPVTS